MFLYSYGLDYAEFVVPLVKAVQELSKINDAKETDIKNLKDEVATLRSDLQNIKAMLVAGQSTGINQLSASVSSVSLSQNVPNPFTNTTMINYTLPKTYSSANIIITNKTGRTIKAINISGSGKGSITVDASLLTNGAYSYALYVDGKLVDSKQMMRIR